MNNVLIFSHEQDVDGIFSAAILKIAFPSAQVILTNYGLERMRQLKDKIFSFTLENEPGLIIISDISPNEESYLPVFEALEHSSKLGWNNVWIDHHRWPDSTRDVLSKVCELYINCDDGDQKKCSAELCLDKYVPQDKVAITLAKVAHRTDFPDSARFPLPPITALISYYMGFPESYEKLYSVILDNAILGILWTTEMQNDMIVSSKINDDSIANSLSLIKLVDLVSNQDTFKVAIVKADSFVNRSILLGKVMSDFIPDIAIAFTGDGRVSIRKNNNQVYEKKIRCDLIARGFKEGGGHEAAAGGFLTLKPIDIVNGDQNAIKEILDVLSTFLAKEDKVN